MIIYLVDDDPANNFLSKVILEEVGFKGTTINFNYATEAIEDLQTKINEGKSSELPDMIFLDINLPMMDGWEFLEEYAKLPFEITQKIRIYMLSSTINPADIDKANNSPYVKEFLSKPITIEAAAEILEQSANVY